MKPAEFWALHPTEFWWLFEIYHAASRPGYAGDMTQAEVEEIYREAYGDG